jgi:tRNA modification GTPase
VVEGYKVVLADMAGLRAAGDAIEAEGVRRARAWAQGADLRLWVIDAAASDGAWREARDLVTDGDLMVFNKSDLPAGRDRSEAAGAGKALSVAAPCGHGVDALAAEIGRRVVAALTGAEFPAVTRERHAGLLRQALGSLRRVDIAALEAPELAAEDLRLAARALERVAGRIGAEDVLDAVFASFCMGK